MENLNITLKELVDTLNKEGKKLVGVKFDDRYLKDKNILGKHKIVHGFINEILKQKELDYVMTINPWNIRIKCGITTPYGVRLLITTSELMKYSFKIKENKRIKYGSAGIIEDIKFALVEGVDENLTLNEMLYDLSIKEVQECIEFNEDKIAKLKKDLKHAEKEKEYYKYKLNEIFVDK